MLLSILVIEVACCESRRDMLKQLKLFYILPAHFCANCKVTNPEIRQSVLASENRISQKSWIEFY